MSVQSNICQCHIIQRKRDIYKMDEKLFFQRKRNIHVPGWGRGGSPIKKVIPLEKMSCYVTKHKHTIRKFLIIKSINVELLKA